MPRNARPVLIAIEGISGAGKSTIVARAAATFGWVPLAEAYDRLVPRPRIDITDPAALARVERTLLAEEARRFRTARALRASGATVVADTGFLGPLTYTRALASLGTVRSDLLPNLIARARRLADREAWGVPDVVVYLETRPAVRRRRVEADAGRHPSGLAARHEAVGRLEARFYEELLPRALPGRVRRIDGNRAAARVVAGLDRSVRGIPPLRGQRRATRRVLDLIAGAGGPATGSATVKKTPQSARAPFR